MVMLNLLRRTLLVGALCTASFGCTESTTTTTRTNPSSEPGVSVTVKKPVMPNDRDSSNGVNTDGANSPQSVSRTNTGVNSRDRVDSTKTPFDQNENKADIKITADIRSRVVDTEMSVDAQNVKIITQNGMVTLRGPVHTADEKAQVEKIAKDIAGKDNVDSQLEIAAD